MRHTLAVLSFASFAAVATAQTFVVDASNGPGANFTSLSAATAAAPDGAILLVRPGTYVDVAVQIVGKGLTILAEPGAKMQGVFSTLLWINGIAPTQAVVIRGLEFSAGSLNPATVNCGNNAGRIFLDGVGQTSGGGPTRLLVDHCAALIARNCLFRGACSSTDSVAVFDGCTFDGASSATPSINGGFTQVGGDVQFVDCLLRSNAVFGAAALTMTGGAVRINGTSALINAFSSGFVIVGTGSVRVAPSVTLTGTAPYFAATIAATVVDTPRLRLDEIAPAGTWRGSLHGPIGHAGWVLVALPVNPFTLPFLADTDWLDPFTTFILNGGFPAAGAPVTATLSMPAVTSTLGFPVMWQGLTLDAVAGFQISNPEVSLLH